MAVCAGVMQCGDRTEMQQLLNVAAAQNLPQSGSRVSVAGICCCCCCFGGLSFAQLIAVNEINQFTVQCVGETEIKQNENTALYARLNK